MAQTFDSNDKVFPLPSRVALDVAVGPAAIVTLIIGAVLQDQGVLAVSALTIISGLILATRKQTTTTRRVGVGRYAAAIFWPLLALLVGLTVMVHIGWTEEGAAGLTLLIVSALVVVRSALARLRR